VPKLWWLLAASALSFALAGAWIALAQRKALFDQPEGRRLHTLPTPRGAGVGFVLVMIGVLVVVAPMTWAAALGVVAIVSLRDDWRSLSARVRLVAHTFAALMVVIGWWRASAVLLGELPGAVAVLHGLVVALALIALVASINLHNFMDGANGLVALSAALALATIGVLAPDVSTKTWTLLAAAAIAGFVPWNFPHARAFMGDVGSASIGFMVGLGLLALWPSNAFFLALLPLSALMTDATLTLLSRLARTRRWYTAHRSHLYQWLIRTGMSHPTVSFAYALWTLLAAIAAIALNHAPLSIILVVLAGVYGGAAIVWFAARRRLRDARRA
jgi:UDP-N-acetylmuramyl pentapeptide phosphotransferase/UDP-N-acetylglucosamine-1-phosphate transferase